MDLDYRHEPMPAQWPGKPRPSAWRPRDRTPFKMAYFGTEALLERELRHLKAREVVIHLDVANPERDLRFDGKLRADARPTSARVLLSFKDEKGHRQFFPCDTFRSWQANLHAIAVTLERMRQVELYDVVWGGQQYVGFKRLPGAGGSTVVEPPAMSPEQAAEVVARFSEFPTRLIETEASVCKVAIAQARRRTHPDTGGNAEHAATVNEAATVLEAHHGRAL